MIKSNCITNKNLVKTKKICISEYIFNFKLDLLSIYQIFFLVILFFRWNFLNDIPVSIVNKNTKYVQCVS